MTRIRVIAKRGDPLNLQDVNLVDILNFNTEFDIQIVKRLDNGPEELVQDMDFIPATEPTPPGPQPEPEPTNVLWDSNNGWQVE